MAERDVNAPLASSCGRLFDAVAAAVGLCRDRTCYEGHAAMMLEAATATDDDVAYPFTIVDVEGLLQLDPAPLWGALLDDLIAATPVAIIARRFHSGLADAIANMVEALAPLSLRGRGHETVALSGGVFQNRLLLELVTQRLEAQGLRVLTHRAVPANDGGLALGQAAIAAAHLLCDEKGE
jgi:hydrogenase maturation protein HypF